jgi:hypothetical protein
MDQVRDAAGPVLIVQSSGVTFGARLDGPKANAGFGVLENGSRLRVTGVCWKQVDASGTFQSFQLLLPTPAQPGELLAGGACAGAAGGTPALLCWQPSGLAGIIGRDSLSH